MKKKKGRDMTKEEIYELAKNDLIIHSGIHLGDVLCLSWEDTLMIIVKELSINNKSLTKDLIEINKIGLPPIYLKIAEREESI